MEWSGVEWCIDDIFTVRQVLEDRHSYWRRVIGIFLDVNEGCVGPSRPRGTMAVFGCEREWQETTWH